VKQQPDEIFISQDKYVADILKKFDFCFIKIATTPIELNKPLVKDKDDIDIDVHVYRSMIGSQMYLTASRPDIMFVVCACARFQVTLKEAFSDSDYGGASLDRKSTTEYVATANCCGQVLWIQNQMMDYGFNFMNTKIHIDNESTICIVKNPVYHSRTKHIEIRHHFIRDCYEKRLIDVIKIHTDANVADLLTKGFDVTRFNFLVIIDSKEYTIIEASVRSKLQLADATGIHNLSDAEIYAGLATLGMLQRGAADGSRSYEAPLPEGNTSGSAEDSVQLRELMVLVPTLVTRINSLEKELKDTKQTLGTAVLKLVKKVKSLETALKRKSKKVIVSESESEEPEDQGRIIQDIDDDPLVSLVRESMKEKPTDFVTPTKASGEAQEEDISPTILEAAKTLSKVASQDVNTGSTKVDSGTASKRGQREGKAPMVEEDIQATHKTKEQMRQEEAGLEEAIKLQAKLDEEVAKQIHLDKMIAKEMAERGSLSENNKRKEKLKFNLKLNFILKKTGMLLEPSWKQMQKDDVVPSSYDIYVVVDIFAASTSATKGSAADDSAEGTTDGMTSLRFVFNEDLSF
ncbi:hypothetical protein Tco_0930264, partial [Tanacetum coccineum]